MLVEEVFDASEEMSARVASENAVVTIGVELHLELCALLDELLNQFDCVLEMHVVIRHSVA